MVIVSKEWRPKDGDTNSTSTSNINNHSETVLTPLSTEAGGIETVPTETEIAQQYIEKNENKGSTEFDGDTDTKTLRHIKSPESFKGEKRNIGAVVKKDCIDPNTESKNKPQRYQSLSIMDVKPKSEEVDHKTICEKHESETNNEQYISDVGVVVPDATITNIEIENNNVEYDNILDEEPCDNSNTCTLPRMGTQRQQTQCDASLNVVSTKPFSPQVLNSAINSVVNSNSNALTQKSMALGGGGGSSSLFSTLGLVVNNGALQQPQSARTLAVGLNSNEVESLQSQQLEGSSMIIPTPTGELTNIDNSTGEAKIILLCEPNSHPFQTRNIQLMPNVECKVGRLIAKSKANEGNAIFDCKVLSRNHAVLWYTSDDGKFWVKDTKSSNGTFINDNKLGNEPSELHYGDVVKFGVDVLENSRKEVHGCIIALVKLYLPDGREAISLDAAQAQRLQFSSGPNRITYDEIQRLNAFMQEAAQREKVLKQKLCSLQNVLDSTRKNSTLCWQSMISEDQLLHKINLLEKKLQIMEKNVPENSLRNEIMKLLDDKTSYQLTAKEALRKVYQERCDALQMLSKLETTCATSENECTILRGQIMNTKQSLEEVNDRLQQLETEYNEYKDETTRQQQEAKSQEESCFAELTQKLQNSMEECEMLRQKAHSLENLLKEHEQAEAEQEQQAIAQFDAALADMDEDDDDEEELDDKQDDEMVQPRVEQVANSDQKTSQHQKRKKKSKEEQALMQKVVRKSTVMKWLQNSELSKGDDSKELLKAIFNDSDSCDEHENDSTNLPMFQLGEKLVKHEQGEKNVNMWMKFSNILENVQQNLQKVEEEQISSPSDDFATRETDDEQMNKTDTEATTDTVVNEELKTNVEIKGDMRIGKNYRLLKESVDLLRDTFNEICQEQQQTSQREPLNTEPAVEQSQIHDQTSISSSSSAVKKLENQNTIVSDTSDDKDVAAVHSDELLTEHKLEMLQIECDGWKDKVSDLNIMISKLSEQNKVLEEMIADSHLKQISAEPRISAGTSINSDTSKPQDNDDALPIIEVETAIEESIDCKQFEEQLQSELASVNSKQLEEEEELILYKERLEQSESCNIQLRNEISQLKLLQRSQAHHFIYHALPFGAVAIAALVYLLSGRF